MSSSGEAQSSDKATPNPHAQNVASIERNLETDVTHGLMRAEAIQRLDKYGPNTLPRIRGSFWQVYLAPILNGLILIYLIVIGILVVIVFFFETGGTANIVVWIVIIAFNAILAIVQQYRAQKKLEALQSLTADTTMVIREGIKNEIPADQVVPGDIVVLAQGDRIPADGRLVEAHQLTVVEASLTGESTPVEKTDARAPLAPDLPLHSRNNMVYCGTYVATGSGRYLVTGTG
ncbi:MAG: HAD-IC family P-type ATPase, partial [Candidatus Hermodarchaeia archaeon]